jgi:hypothetical protein
MVTLTKKQEIAIIEGMLCAEEIEKNLKERWFLDPEIPVTRIC